MNCVGTNARLEKREGFATLEVIFGRGKCLGAELLHAAQGEPVSTQIAILGFHVPCVEIQVQAVGGTADGRTPIDPVRAYVVERTISWVPPAGADEENQRS